MKKATFAISFVIVSGSLTSCSSIMRSVGGLVEAVGRSAGLNMTDAPAQPITIENSEEQKGSTNSEDATTPSVSNE